MLQEFAKVLIFLLLIIICLFAIAEKAEASEDDCDEDDLTDYVMWVDVMPVGKSEWYFLKPKKESK